MELTVVDNVDQTEINFLNYIFPNYIFKYQDKKLYIQNDFKENINLEILKLFGFFRVYTFENKIENLVSRKRNRLNNIFNKNEWFSPSKIKLVIDEPFKLMINELCRDKIKYSEIDNLVMKKGNDYEKYILEKLEKKLKDMNINIKKICMGFPNLNNYNMLRESYMSIAEGLPVIYQPLLIDTKSKIMGLPDFLVRCDIFNKIFENDKCNVEINKFGNYNYIVIDVKLAGCKLLKDGYLNNEKYVKLNKIQLYIYQQLLENIEGTHNLNKDGYILGSKTVENNKIYNGIEKLGVVNLSNNDEYNKEIENGIKLINEVRDSRNIKSLLKNRDFKPKRCKSYYFPKSEDGYTDIRHELGYYNNINFKYNIDGIKEICKELEKYNLIYVDFETINLLLNLDCDEFQKRIDETNNEVCQIGVMYKNRNNNIHYRSYFADEYNPKSVEKNFKDFVKFILKLKCLNNRELCMVTWGNLETSIYDGLKEKYNLPEMKILDFHNLIKSNKVFSDVMSLSLKKIIPMLNKYYPNYFPNKYDDLEIKSGTIAFNELYNYYQIDSKDKKKEIKKNIEEYNKLDCLVMLQMVEWLGSVK